MSNPAYPFAVTQMWFDITRSHAVPPGAKLVLFAQPTFVTLYYRANDGHMATTLLDSKEVGNEAIVGRVLALLVRATDDRRADGLPRNPIPDDPRVVGAFR